MFYMKNLLVVLLAVTGLLMPRAAAADVPRKEYPRPQFERSAWVNLNGQWDFTFDFVNTGEEKGFPKATSFDGKITVPFCPESRLSGVGHTDFINHIWYHRVIDIPKEWDGKKILLNFGAVYYESEVYIDGQIAGRHFGGSSSFAVDITPFVQAGKSHHLVVKASSDLRSGLQTAGKQSLHHESHGCNYTRTTGIWQTVWMEAVSFEGLQSAQVLTDIDQSLVIVRPRFYAEGAGTLEVTLKDGDKKVASAKVPATNSAVAVLHVKKAKLWSPESPFLYGLSYRLTDARGNVIDEVDSYVGMRKVHVAGNKVYLNNRPYYQRLVLDQGFYPDGIWTAPSDEALKKDIELSMAAGFNGARLHQKVFEERFYYWADKLGYLTWGEAPSWGMDANNVEVARNFLAEWQEIVCRDRNHPSLLIWTPLNEEWWPDRVQYPRLVADLYNLTKAIDPTRPFHDASGGVHVKTDIWSVHDYEQNPEQLQKNLVGASKKSGSLFQRPGNLQGNPQQNIGFNAPQLVDEYNYPAYDGTVPFLVDEVGGIKWVKGQDKGKSDSSWGYGQPPKSAEEFIERLRGQIAAVLALHGQIWGYCYTQLTDVEQEQNGIYYYDRTPKFDMEAIREIFMQNPAEE